MCLKELNTSIFRAKTINFYKPYQPYQPLLPQSAHRIFCGAKSFPTKAYEFGGTFNFSTELINPDGSALKIMHDFLQFGPGGLVSWFFWLLLFHESVVNPVRFNLDQISNHTFSWLLASPL